jgi:hypothetical protein
MIFLSICLLTGVILYGIEVIKDTRYWTKTIEVRPVNLNIEAYERFDVSAPKGKTYIIDDGRMIPVDIEGAVNGG